MPITYKTRRTYPGAPPIGRYTPSSQHHKLMQAAFDMVCDATHWKNPVDALVPWDIANVCVQSVEFMTGTKATAERVSGPNGEDLAHITAPGYYAGPCN
jgi:hypothetical protein